MIMGILIFIILAVAFGIAISSYRALDKEGKKVVRKIAGIATIYFIVCSILALTVLLSIVHFF